MVFTENAEADSLDAVVIVSGTKNKQSNKQTKKQDGPNVANTMFWLVVALHNQQITGKQLPCKYSPNQCD